MQIRPNCAESVLREIQENRPPRVVINLSKVHYIDSSGVASLVEGLKASRDLGSRFILFGLSTAAREILQLSRLIKVFEVYENEEAGVGCLIWNSSRKSVTILSTVLDI